MKILVVDTGKMYLINSIITGLENRGHDCRIRVSLAFPNIRGLKPDMLWADIIFATYLSMDRWTYALTNMSAKMGLKLATWTELDMSLFQPVNFRLVNWDGVAICFGDNPAVLERYAMLANSATRFIYSPRAITQIPFSTHEESPFQPVKDKKFGKSLGLAGAYWREWKRPFLALECYRKLKERDPEWMFEMVGAPAEFRAKELEDGAANLGVKLLPHLNRINKLIPWYQDKDITLNTSDYEGNPKTMIEGVLCGNFPMVRNWPGAKSLYPEECVFNGSDEFVQKVLAWQSLPNGTKKELMMGVYEEVLRKYRPGHLTTIAEDAFRVVLEDSK